MFAHIICYIDTVSFIQIIKISFARITKENKYFHLPPRSYLTNVPLKVLKIHNKLQFLATTRLDSTQS